MFPSPIADPAMAIINVKELPKFSLLATDIYYYTNYLTAQISEKTRKIKSYFS